jgi:hypothetical protein
MHAISFSVPETLTVHEKKSVYEFMHSLKHLLPCHKCRKHFSIYLGHTMFSPSSAALETRDSLSRWCVNVHNSVNRRTGKEMVEYDTVKRFFTSKDNLCGAPNSPVAGADDAVCQVREEKFQKYKDSMDTKTCQKTKRHNAQLRSLAIVAFFSLFLTFVFLAATHPSRNGGSGRKGK